MAAELALLEGTLGLRNGTKYGAQGERQVKGAGGGPRATGGSASSPARFVPRRRRAALPAPSRSPAARLVTGLAAGNGLGPAAAPCLQPARLCACRGG